MAEKNEKLMPRGLSRLPRRFWPPPKSTRFRKGKGCPKYSCAGYPASGAMRGRICRHSGRLPDAGRFCDRIKNKDDQTAVAHLP